MHLGLVLNEVYLKDLGLDQSQFAANCGCSPIKINEIVNGKRSISPEFALVLEKVLGTTAEMWVRIAAEYHLWLARKKSAQPKFNSLPPMCDNSY